VGEGPDCRTGCVQWCRGQRWRWKAILGNPASRRFSFVGSTPIARYVYEKRHRAPARACSLRRAAKNHMVGCPTRDLDMAEDDYARVSRGRLGGVSACMAGGAGRGDPIGDDLVSRISRRRVAGIRVGPARRPVRGDGAAGPGAATGQVAVRLEQAASARGDTRAWTAGFPPASRRLFEGLARPSVLDHVTSARADTPTRSSAGC